VGRWPIRGLYYRPDRVGRPRTALPIAEITPALGWCDAPGDANYNRPVPLPYPASHERLWREDHLYDLLLVLGFNDAPRAQRRGSAIFLHLTHPDYRPTEGCVAIAPAAMMRLLERLALGDELLIV
jgi:L,D-peptidoglycan transpeptidase YkuD (ErfK/YbiS/YcfS/YnhG family)